MTLRIHARVGKGTAYGHTPGNQSLLSVQETTYNDLARTGTGAVAFYVTGKSFMTICCEIFHSTAH